jgi:integrase/recombinase XerD
LLQLILETGIKKSECLNLKLAHVFNEETGSYIFVRYPTKRTAIKREKYRSQRNGWKFINATCSNTSWRMRYFPGHPAVGVRTGRYWKSSRDCKTRIIFHVPLELRPGRSPADMESDAIRQKLGISKIQWREISLKLKELSRTYVSGDHQV